MAVSDLTCLLCHRPAVAVMSTRIDPGQAHYPTCATHVGAMGARLAIDCARAVSRRGGSLTDDQIVTERRIIDVDASDSHTDSADRSASDSQNESPNRSAPVTVAGHLDASQQWIDAITGGPAT